METHKPGTRAVVPHRALRRFIRKVVTLGLVATVVAGALTASPGVASAIAACSEYVQVFQTTSNGSWVGPGTRTSAPGEFTIDTSDLAHRYVTMAGETRPRRGATFRFLDENDNVLLTKTTLPAGDNGVIRQEFNVTAWDFAQPGQRIRVFADYRHRCGGDDVHADNVFVGTIITTDPTLEAPPAQPDIEVPGGGGTTAGPAAVAYQGSEYVFVRGGDDRIYVNRFDGTNWTGWGVVPGGHTTPSAVSVTVYFGILYMVHRGMDNRIYWDRFDGSTWTSLGEVCCGGLTVDAPAVTSLQAELVVVVRGTDNGIHLNKFDRFANTWSGWSLVPGGFTTPSGPAATVFNNGTLDVLQLAIRGFDSRVYTNRFNPFDGTWTGWGEIPGGISTPSAPDLVVGNTVMAAVRGFDDQLYLNRFDGTNWLGWSQIASVAVVVDDPALSVFNGGVAVYTRVADNRIFKTLALDEVETDVDGDAGLAMSAAEGAQSSASAAAVLRIVCNPRSAKPIRFGPKLIGHGETNCTAPMGTLIVNVALWRVVPLNSGGVRGFWTLADHQHNASVGRGNVLQSVGVTCTASTTNLYAITTAHTMIPPPGFRPPSRFTITNSSITPDIC